MASIRRRYNQVATPAQAGGYAVIDPPPPRRTVASTSALSLFGLEFLIEADGSLVAPNKWYLDGAWKGAVFDDAQGLRLSVAANVQVLSIFTIELDLVIALERDGSGGLSPTASQPQQGPNSYFRLSKAGRAAGTGPMVLDYGYFAVQAGPNVTDWLSAIDGIVYLTATAASVWGSSQIPVDLGSGSGAWTINLGTARCLVSAQSDALRLGLSCLDLKTTSPIQLSELSSTAFDVDLSSVVSFFTCRFGPRQEEDWLPLGVERASDVAETTDDELVVSYGAKNFALEATWSGETTLATLEAIELLPAAGFPSFSIDVFSLIRPDGTSMRFDVPGRLPCWVRPGGTQRPGTLLLGFDPASSGLLQMTSGDYLGWDDALVFGSGSTATLEGLSEAVSPAVNGLSAGIAKTISLPYLVMEGEPVSVRVSRNEGRWRDAAQRYEPVCDVANWLFSGQRLRLPVCPRRLVLSAHQSTITKFNGNIRPAPGELVAQPWDIRHETRFHDLPDLGPGPWTLAALGGLPDLEDFGEQNTVEEYRSVRRFGALQVPKTVAANEKRLFDLLTRSEAGTLSFSDGVPLEFNAKLTLAKGAVTFAAGHGMDDWPAFLGVYNSTLSIAEILEANLAPNVVGELMVHCSGLFDTDLFPRGWIGAILFGIEGHSAPGSEFEIALGPTFSIGFVALTEDPSELTSIYAAQAYITKNEQPARLDAVLEAALDVTEFELYIFRNQLLRMASSIRVTIWSMLGLAAQNGGIDMMLRASLNGDRLEIRGYLDRPETVVDGGQAPLRAIRILSAAGRAFDQSGYGLALKVEILIEPLAFGSTFAWFGTVQSDQWIALSNMVLMPHVDQNTGYLYLEPKYGSIEFGASGDHFHFTDILGASIRLKTIGISWGGDVESRRADLVPIFKHDPPATGEDIIWFEAELDAGGLSSFASSPGERLILRFMVQFPVVAGASDPGRYWVGMSTAAIRNFTVGLYRIASLHADDLVLSRTTTGVEEIPYFDFINASIEVAGQTLVSGVTARIFIGRSGQGGFLACWEPKAGPGKPKWLLAGHNVRIAQSALDTIMRPAPETSSDGSLQAILERGQNDLILPRGTLSGRQDVADWVLATAFDLSGLFSIKVLLSDVGYAGLTLAGEGLFNVIGLKGISVLYIRGATPSDDRFNLSVSLPNATIGPFGFFGGVLRVTVTPAGDFLFDLGFPWMRRSGLREWDRTIGAMVSGLQASGGFYIEHRANHIINKTQIEVSAGYAVQWGIGGRADFGPASASFRAGYFLVAEGSATFSHGLDLHEVHLLGAGGVLIEAEASVNLWILAARITILASAEVSVGIDWKDTTLLPPPAPVPAAAKASDEIVIALRLIVGIRIHAQVTVDLWVGSKTFAVTVDTSIDMSTSFKVRP